MTRFAIATAVYPQNRRYIADYVAGVTGACRNHAPVTLILAADYGFDAAAELGRMEGGQLDIQQSAVAGTPASLRRLLLTAASRATADVIVFTDFDDRLLPDALEWHAEALRDADISYGDLTLMDEEGRNTGQNFFEAAAVPARIEGNAALRRRNFVGFGNSAVRRSVLSGPALSLPDDLVAADWWFFTLLLANERSAQRTKQPVALYRTHRDSVLGANPVNTARDLQRRAEFALRYYQQLPAQVSRVHEMQDVADLLRWIDQSPDAADALAQRLSKMPGVWFEDVARACDAVRIENGTCDRCAG